MNGRTAKDLMRIIDVCKRHRWIIIVAVLLSLSVSLGIAFLSPKYYLAKVTALPRPRQDELKSGLSPSSSGVIGLLGLAGVGSMEISSRDEIIAILKSNAFTTMFIRENNIELLLAEAQRSGGVIGRFLGRQNQTIWSVAKYFDDEVRTIREDPRTGLIQIEISWTDPVVASSWANNIVDMLNRNVRSHDKSEAEKSLSYLRSELVSTSPLAVQQAIYGLLEREMRRIMLVNVQEDYALRVIDPALPPDIDAFARPRRLVIVSLGGCIGLVLSLLVVLVRELPAAARREPDA